MTRAINDTSTTLAKWSCFLAYKELAEKKLLSGGWAEQALRREWQPLRYATREGNILGAWTWRALPRRGHCEIGLFVCEDHQLYKRGSALNWSLRCIFTQAFHQAATMEIRFVGPRKGQQATLETGFEPVVPEEIRALAEELGIRLKHRDRILDAEGRQIYFCITGFDEELIAGFAERGIDPIWPCVLIQKDIWTAKQIRFIFEHAPSPERVFTGDTSPVRRLSYLRELAVLRLILMAERLQSILERFSGHDDCTASVRWTSPTEVTFACDRDLEISVLDGSTENVGAGCETTVMLLPRNASEYRYCRPSDEAAAGTASLVCVTRDYRSSLLPTRLGQRHVIPLFDTLDDIDREIELRLAQSVTNEAALSERHE